MGLTIDDLAGLRGLPGGWPSWVVAAPYVAAAHPQSLRSSPLDEGANCQTYAYAVLDLFGLHVPPHRSSELWDDPDFEHPHRDDARDLDLALFGPSGDAWGAHVAVILGGRLLHLSAEEGRPALWDWQDFAARDRYSRVVGVVRVTPTDDAAG
ncbi:MAG: hydrolase [Humibacter sp.]